MTPHSESAELVEFLEKVVELLDEGSKTTTYKYAVLLALIELVVSESRHGMPADMITTRQLAEKVIEIYWCQANRYSPLGDIPAQNNNRSKQALIISDILDFKASTKSKSFRKSSAESEERFASLVKSVERVLIDQPLPKLQKFRSREERFIYQIAWSDSQKQNLKQVTAYQKGLESDFDNAIRLVGDAPKYLLLLSKVIKTLIHRHWALDVARINGLPYSEIEKFLFKEDREAVNVFHDPLLDLQSCKCFYCDKTIRSKGEVDHFIPWAAYRNDEISNYVVAHKECNSSKSDHIASVGFLEKLLARKSDANYLTTLHQLADHHNWAIRDDLFGAQLVAYRHLSPGANLWLKGRVFETVNMERVNTLTSNYYSGS